MAYTECSSVPIQKQSVDGFYIGNQSIGGLFNGFVLTSSSSLCEY